MNNVYLSGNLVSDVQVRIVKETMKVANVSIAVKGEGPKGKDITDFIDLVMWGRTAELAGQHFTKGQTLSVFGRLKKESWTDKKTNQTVSKTIVNVNQILNLPQFDKTTNQDSYNSVNSFEVQDGVLVN